MEIYKLARLNDQDGNLDKRWYVYYSYLHPETSKYQLFKKFISVRIHTKYARRLKAQELIDLINKKLRSGWNPFSQEEIRFRTCIEAVTHVIEVKKHTLRRRSNHTYKVMGDIFTLFLKENGYQALIIESFNYNYAQMFMDWAKRTRHISNRTYNNYIMHMRTIFNELVKRDYLAFNPFNKVNKLLCDQTEIIYYTDSERNRIRTLLPVLNFELWIVSQMIYYCFLRPQEIVRLRIQDINLIKKVINVSPKQSKVHKQRIIRIPDPFYKELQKFDLSRYPQDWYIFSTRLKPGANEIQPTRIAGAWSDVRETLGISKNKHIYYLKHNGMGLCVANHITARDLQLHAGQHSLEMVQIYLERFSSQASDDLIQNFPEL